MTAKVDASAQTAASVEEVETPVVTGNAKILVEEGIKTGLNQSTIRSDQSSRKTVK